MEFGVFVGMYHPNHRRAQGETEQDVLRAELDVVQAADRSGFKYVWVTEHHFLDEYSHLSANEAWMAYALAITDNIHIGSGIINITPPVCHPARVAEKVAMLDQLAPGRFEFGVGRGSSSTEVLGFGIDSMDTTRDMFDEALPEIVKMMGPDEYGPYEGRFFSLPRRQVLPKPVTLPHPPIWVAAGSPGTFEKAARMGIGVLCFSFAGTEALKPLIDVYKNTIEDAEPVGGYVNNNVMVTTAMMTLEDGARAREVFRHNQSGYHTSLVAKYLDSFPQAAGIDKTPRLDAADAPRAGEQGDRDGRDRGGYTRRGDQHHAQVRGDRRRSGVVRRPVGRHAIRRRGRIGRDLRQVRVARVRPRPGALDARVSGKRSWASRARSADVSRGRRRCPPARRRWPRWRPSPVARARRHRARRVRSGRRTHACPAR